MKAGLHHDIRSAYLELSGKGKGPVVSATMCELIEAHRLGSDIRRGRPHGGFASVAPRTAKPHDEAIDVRGTAHPCICIQWKRSNSTMSLVLPRRAVR
jgi:hypothetical protein